MAPNAFRTPTVARLPTRPTGLLERVSDARQSAVQTATSSPSATLSGSDARELVRAGRRQVEPRTITRRAMQLDQEQHDAGAASVETC